MGLPDSGCVCFAGIRHSVDTNIVELPVAPLTDFRAFASVSATEHEIREALFSICDDLMCVTSSDGPRNAHTWSKTCTELFGT